MADKPSEKATDKANTLVMRSDAKKSRAKLMAEVALSPAILNASTARKYVSSVAGELDFTELVAVMNEKAALVKGGDLSGLEATLTAQAVLLDGIFNELARRAALNIGEHLQAMDVYMRLALKAQSQCRTSIEALAEIKNPRPVAFVKQANIAHGPQQVNNGVSTPANTSRTEKSANPSNELTGENHELLPDTRASKLAGGVNQKLETVGAIDRATHESRQTQKRGQQ